MPCIEQCYATVSGIPRKTSLPIRAICHINGYFVGLSIVKLCLGLMPNMNCYFHCMLQCEQCLFHLAYLDTNVIWIAIWNHFLTIYLHFLSKSCPKLKKKTIQLRRMRCGGLYTISAIPILIPIHECSIYFNLIVRLCEHKARKKSKPHLKFNDEVAAKLNAGVGDNQMLLFAAKTRLLAIAQ